ncbi:MAG TPA: hypothetical protein VN883_01590 [Myxococcales bacterium]|jgi:hypothetical protein|nr:hypothetical protein [Myxococcales bacterium]
MTEPEMLLYRSTGPVPEDVAAALAAEVLRPRGDRCWAPATGGSAQVCASPGASRRFAAEVGSGEPGCCEGSLAAVAAAQEDLLWVLCQLARCARDYRVDFEVRLGDLRGRVGTFGLDEGARAMLARSQPGRARRVHHFFLAGKAATPPVLSRARRGARRPAAQAG